MTIMNEVLLFLESIGLFDVILPFLLIYVMIFALLERTKILGVEKYDKVTVTKKNLNAIFAFASAFFAILSSQVITTLNKAIGPIMILMLIIILSIVLVSVFKTDEEGGFHQFTGAWLTTFIIIIILTVLLIFMNSIENDDGDTWLEIGWEYASDNTNTGFVGATVLLVLVAGFIFWIGHSPSSKPPGDPKKNGN